nr:pirin family protein [Nitrospirota bacterium]
MQTKGPDTGLVKAMVEVHRHGSAHMVGDGFPVRNLIPGNTIGEQLSPFLLLDYAGPTYFPPTDTPRGVGEHPHRGFETVTIVYQGMVAHRDSAGHAGVIGPGDVQWMTAASGIVHEELHERQWAKRGGTLQAIQLWVNLPAAFKMTAPRYQPLVKEQIPVIPLDGGAGSVRVIAGEFNGARGPATTFTPVQLHDLHMKAQHGTTLRFAPGWNVALFVLDGQVTVNGSEPVTEAQLAVIGDSGAPILVEAQQEATMLVMAGEPIREPIARYGPFVMNTKAELAQAVQDYQAGKMGHLAI